MGQVLKGLQGFASYPALFEPKPFDETDPREKWRYGVNLVFPKTDKKQEDRIRNAIRSVCVEEFGKDADRYYESFTRDRRIPLADGDSPNTLGVIKEELAGMWILAAYNKTRPMLLRANKEQIHTNDGTFYAGAKIILLADIYVSRTKGLRVTAGCSGVQYAGDGISFGGGYRAKLDDFADVELDSGGLV